MVSQEVLITLKLKDQPNHKINLLSTGESKPQTHGQDEEGWMQEHLHNCLHLQP